MFVNVIRYLKRSGLRGTHEIRFPTDGRTCISQPERSCVSSNQRTESNRWSSVYDAQILPSRVTRFWKVKKVRFLKIFDVERILKYVNEKIGVRGALVPEFGRKIVLRLREAFEFDSQA